MRITHLEDLTPVNFIKVLRNLDGMRASEKLDGSNLKMGLDENGKFYTAKFTDGKRYYSASDYGVTQGSTPFRAAHLALEEQGEIIGRVLNPYDVIEIEVLYGPQPNAVSYADDSSSIAILRALDSTPRALVKTLSNSLNDKTSAIKLEVFESPDGKALNKKTEMVNFKFVTPKELRADQILSSDAEEKLSEFEKFLDDTITVGDAKLSNFDILVKNVSSFGIDKAEAVVLKKEIEDKVLNDFKLPIKKQLLQKIASEFKDRESEGVVIYDPVTDEQVKVVDKDKFTAVNKFNYAARNQLVGNVLTTDPDATLESRGGLFGNLNIRIAELLGNRSLAKPSEAKKFFSSNKGETPIETVKNAAKNLGDHPDFLAIKGKILAMISSAQNELSDKLEEFKDDKDDIVLTLDGGAEVKLTDEVIKRTLLVFADVKEKLEKLETITKGSKSFETLLAGLFGQKIKSASLNEELIMLTEKNHLDADKRQYGGRDAWTMLNVYLATLFLAVIIYKHDDKPGIRLLRDKSHARLTAWHRDMSALNFWGYAIWRSASPTVQKLIGKKVATEIAKITKRVPTNWWRYLHLDLSFGKDKPIAWSDHLRTIKMLQQFPGLNVDRINNIRDPIFRYEELSFDEKIKLHNKLYYYCMLFIPTSPLLYRFRQIGNDLLLQATEGTNQMLEEKLLSKIVKLAETAEAGGVSAGGASGITSAVNIATVEKRLGSDKLIVKRKRNPELKYVKFPKPTDLGEDNKENK